MRPATGRWVSGNDFFDRESELRVLEAQVQDGNHILLTGQRRMGKTSIVRELGRRLEEKDWIFLFTDVEGATCAEDAIADIAQAVHPVRSISSRFMAGMKRWTGDIEEVSALDFRVKVRAGLDAGSWRRDGERLLKDCVEQDKPVLLVIDELPIFLKRMLGSNDGARRVDEFLSWMRGVLQSIGDRSLVLIVSGSIGLAPLVRRLGLPDRINHLNPVRLGPWNRDTSVDCFNRLAKSCGLKVGDGVADAVYDRLGIGIPHHVQSFFARLRDRAIMQSRDRVTMDDIAEVYRTGLLGPSGQNDLVHYETRLKEGLEDQAYTIAMEILAEAAIQGLFTPSARHCLERLYSAVVEDAPSCVADTLEVLMHDGYLQSSDEGYYFPSHLLRDWWAARFRGHHALLESRHSEQENPRNEQ